MEKRLHIIALTIALLSGFTGHAENYILKEGDNHGITDNATFTAPKDCNVRIEAADIYTVTYNSTQIAYKYTPTSAHYPYVYEVNDVKTGDVITMTSGFVLNDGIFVSVITAGEVIPVELVSTVPEANQTFTWDRAGQVTLGFNKPVAFGAIKLSAGGKMYDVDEIMGGSSLSFNVTEALNTALTAGTLQPGDNFQIVVRGLYDAEDKKNLYNKTGTLQVTYKAPYPQGNLMSATVGEGLPLASGYTFLSYFSPDEKDGLFTFEFDEEVMSVSEVILTMGNLDLFAQGRYHRSDVPFSIDGKKIIVDARGTLRTLKTLFPAVVEQEPEEGEEINEGIFDFDTEHITLSLSNVIDIHGNPFRCYGEGSVGSYSYIFNYKELIDDVSMDGDNIAEGDDVQAGQEVRLWLSNPTIKFDGIQVTYFVNVTNPDDEAEDFQEPRTVVLTDYTITPDPYEGIIIAFTMPEMEGLVNGTTITVSLHNAQSADGLPHDLYLELKAHVEEVPEVIADVYLVEGENILPDSLTYRAITAAFTAVKDGKVLIEAQELWTVTYNDAVATCKNVFGNGHGAYIYEVDSVKAGTTVYVTSDFVMIQGSSLWISYYNPGESVPVRLNDVTPAADETFSWYRAGQVSVGFNKDVSFDAIKLSAGGKFFDVDDIHGGSIIGFNITSSLNEALRNGDINPGDEFSIVIRGLRDAQDKQNLFNGSGTLQIKYIAPYPQSELVSAIVGDGTAVNSDYDFLSYYSPEEADGVFTFTFGDTIKSVGGISISIGSSDRGSGLFYSSSLHYVINGDKIIVDVRGKLRDLDTLFPHRNDEPEGEEEGEEPGIEQPEADLSHITMAINNVIDIHNNPFISYGAGTVGSYAYVMNYKEILDEASLDGDNVAAGDSICAGQDITLWLSNAVMNFKSITVTYTAAEEEKALTVEEFTLTPDEFEGVVIGFTMPNFSDATPGCTIRVELSDVTSPDGRKHELAIEFKAADMTGIKVVDIDDNDRDIYALNGIRVSDMQSRHVYIVNGHKVLAK